MIHIIISIKLLYILTSATGHDGVTRNRFILPLERGSKANSTYLVELRGQSLDFREDEVTRILGADFSEMMQLLIFKEK